MEKAVALVIRNTDWSETSRISTLWTRELGKVRCLAKGGRRLKSSFESALDLLTVCDIVLIRKTSGSLDLLTEARVQERFSRLRRDLPALYAGYYLAELLGDWTEDYDPHPFLFDEALATLRSLGQPGVLTGPRLARFELVLLRELGYAPALNSCAVCAAAVEEHLSRGLVFSAAAGGVLCPDCRPRERDGRELSPEAWRALILLDAGAADSPEVQDTGARQQVRQALNDYVTYSLGRRPRLLPYLGS